MVLQAIETTTEPKVENGTTEEPTTTTEKYRISRKELGYILGRNYRGLQKLLRIELTDALNVNCLIQFFFIYSFACRSSRLRPPNSGDRLATFSMVKPTNVNSLFWTANAIFNQRLQAGIRQRSGTVCSPEGGSICAAHIKRLECLESDDCSLWAHHAIQPLICFSLLILFN